MRSSASKGQDLNAPDPALVLADTIVEEARAACRRVRRQLAGLGIEGEVVLTGDLLLRVPPGSR